MFSFRSPSVNRAVLKHRPALVLSSPSYAANRDDLIVAAITSRIRDPLLEDDYLLEDWRACGLEKPSVVTAMLRTIKNRAVVRKLGEARGTELAEINGRLRHALGL